MNMFGDLYDLISRLWSVTWPLTDGEITDVAIVRPDDGDPPQLYLAYKFHVGDDGPYSGEYFWKPAYSPEKRVASARRKMRVLQKVEVRYRPDDPSVNSFASRIATLTKGN